MPTETETRRGTGSLDEFAKVLGRLSDVEYQKVAGLFEKMAGGTDHCTCPCSCPTGGAGAGARATALV
jgi:hypothetical protein